MGTKNGGIGRHYPPKVVFCKSDRVVDPPVREIEGLVGGSSVSVYSLYTHLYSITMMNQGGFSRKGLFRTMVSLPVIRTKLHRPPVPAAHLHRKQELDRLDLGRQRPLNACKGALWRIPQRRSRSALSCLFKKKPLAAQGWHFIF